MDGMQLRDDKGGVACQQDDDELVDDGVEPPQDDPGKVTDDKADHKRAGKHFDQYERDIHGRDLSPAHQRQPDKQEGDHRRRIVEKGLSLRQYLERVGQLELRKDGADTDRIGGEDHCKERDQHTDGESVVMDRRKIEHDPGNDGEDNGDKGEVEDGYAVLFKVPEFEVHRIRQ